MQKLVEGCFANTLQSLEIPHIDPLTRTTSNSNIFSKIDNIVNQRSPNSKVYVSGGVVRSVLGFIYWYLINEHQKNPGNAQTKHILEEFLRKNKNLHFQHVLGIGSDLDLLIDRENCLEEVDFVTQEIKKFIDQYQNEIPEELRNFLSIYGDVKNYTYQISRSIKQGGSPIDWLAFPITPRSGDSFREPQTHREILKNFLRGRFRFYPVNNSESRSHTVARVIRTFLDLPFLEPNSESVELLCKELKNLSKNITDKQIIKTFQKGVRNARYYQGFPHPLNRLSLNRSDALALILQEHSRTYKTNKNIPLLPKVLSSQKISERSSDFDPGGLKKDNLLISIEEFNQNYTDESYLYHGTNEPLSLLSMFRGTYILSDFSQGAANFGRGFYSTKDLNTGLWYAEGSPTNLLRFKLQKSPNIRILKLESVPENIKSKWMALAAKSNQDLHEFLFEKFSVDVIINSHILIQNMDVINLPDSISEMNIDWIDTFLSKWTFINSENILAPSFTDIENLKNLIHLLFINKTISSNPRIENKISKIKEAVIKAISTNRDILKTDFIQLFCVIILLNIHNGILNLSQDTAIYTDIAIAAVEQDKKALQYVPKDHPNYADIAIAAMTQDGMALQYVPKDIPNYADIAIAAVTQKSRALQYVSIDHTNYADIAMAAVQQNGWALQYVPKDNPNYADIAMAAVKQEGRVLQYVTQDTPNYPAIAMAAVKQEGMALQYVFIYPPNYANIAMAAVKQNGGSLQYVPKDTPNYADIAMAAVKQNGLALQYVSIYHPNYANIAMAAVQKNGLALRYASIYYPNYADIAMAAVTQNGVALEYVAKDIPNYAAIAVAAVKQNGWSLRYVPKDHPNYADIAMAAVKQEGMALEYVPKDIPNYTDIAMAAVKQEGRALQYVPKDHRSNYADIAMAAVKQNGWALQHVPKDMPNYADIAMEAVKEDGWALQYVAKDTPNYPAIAMAAVKQEGRALQYVPKDHRSNYADIAMAAVKQNGWALQHVPKDTPNYPAIAMAAVKQEGWALQYVAKDTPNYPAIAMAAVKQRGIALEYVPKDHPNYADIAMAAVKQGGWALQYVAKDHPNYAAIAVAAVKQNERSLQCVPKDHPNYADIAIKAVKQTG